MVFVGWWSACVIVKEVSFSMAGICLVKIAVSAWLECVVEKGQFQHVWNVLWKKAVRFSKDGMRRDKKVGFSMARKRLGQN
jgi:hypothetical protein